MTGVSGMQDLKAGDIFLGPIGGALGAGIRAAQVIVDGGWRVGPLHVEHIGIVVEASRTLGPAIRENATGRYTELRDEKSRLAYEIHGASPAFTHYPTGVITAPRMVQAMPHGAEEIEMTAARHWTRKVAYARIPQEYAGQAENAAAIARIMVEHDVAYSFASYAALALYRWGYRAPHLTRWIGRRQNPVPVVLSYDIPGRGVTVRGESMFDLPREAICSVLVDQAWSLAGKRVMLDTAPQAVTPSMLAARLLMDMPGVQWFWPRQDYRAGRDSW